MNFNTISYNMPSPTWDIYRRAEPSGEAEKSTGTKKSTASEKKTSTQKEATSTKPKSASSTFANKSSTAKGGAESTKVSESTKGSSKSTDSVKEVHTSKGITETNSAQASSTALAANGSSSGSSSSAGMIGGIIAAVAVIVIIACAFIVIRRRNQRRKNRAMNQKPDPFTMGFGSDNPPPPPPPQQQQQQKDEDFNYQFSPNTTYQTPIQQQPKVVDTYESVAVPMTPTTNHEHSMGTFTVVATYIPTLSDELEIEAGDQIDLIVEYDDGWCQGINLSKGNTKGVFPRHCIAAVENDLVPPKGINLDVERSKRVSSMYQLK